MSMMSMQPLSDETCKGTRNAYLNVWKRPALVVVDLVEAELVGRELAVIPRTATTKKEP